MFSFNNSVLLARQRLERTSTRRKRSDAGRSRLPPVVLAELRASAMEQDRPSMSLLMHRITVRCAAAGTKPPVRASLYNALARIEGHTYAIEDLPAPVAGALYNLAATGRVPGHQLVFYCFNYGSVPAISFAAGLPWLDLYQARRLRGWRPRSAGLLEAVMRARGIR